VRAVWPRTSGPLSAEFRLRLGRWRSSSEEDLLAIAAALKQAGADVLDVSTGPDRGGSTAGVWPHVQNAVRPTRFAKRNQHSHIAVGNIEADHVNSIIAAGGPI